MTEVERSERTYYTIARHVPKDTGGTFLWVDYAEYSRASLNEVLRADVDRRNRELIKQNPSISASILFFIVKVTETQVVEEV